MHRMDENCGVGHNIQSWRQRQDSWQRQMNRRSTRYGGELDGPGKDDETSVSRYEWSLLRGLFEAHSLTRGRASSDRCPSQFSPVHSLVTRCARQTYS